MTALFSPVGTADPITQLGDGPMLHIVRHYHPDKVVLFLSPEIQGYVQDDKENASAEDVREFGRYEAAIRRLCATEDRPVPEIEVIDSQCKDVFRFDLHIDEFERILKGLCDENPDEPVLVNVTSGTPGFQQALVALGSFGRLRVKLLQVTSPKKGANSRQDREDPHGYDFDDLWDWNEDLRNTDSRACESRVIQVDTPNFADRLIRENVATLVNSYEYMAASEIASESEFINEPAVQMIEAARDRLNLDNRLPTRVFAKTDYAYKPNDPLGEYLSVMEVRLCQGQWADFLRLLTPALTYIAKDELRKSGLPERAYLQVGHDRFPAKLNWDAFDENERLKKVASKWSKKSIYITNSMLMQLVDEFCDDRARVEKLKKLRNVEVQCRNKLAHELLASSRESLERLGGLGLDEVLQYLFDLHGNMRPHLYAGINQAIIERL